MALVDDFRSYCMKLPGTTEEYPWEDHIVWKVGGKMYCVTGDPANTVTLKTTLEKQAALVQDPQITIAAYIGKHGWITISMADPNIVPMTFELIQDSYQMVFDKLPKRAQSLIGT